MAPDVSIRTLNVAIPGVLLARYWAPMSRENVDLVRSIYAAWERGDLSSAEWAHSDIDVVFADGPSPGRWRGWTGMAESWRDFLSAWDRFHPRADEYRQVDDGRVLVLHHFGGRGKRSGLDLRQTRARGAGLFHIRDGKVTRLVAYWDPDRALADLDLAPERGKRE